MTITLEVTDSMLPGDLWLSNANRLIAAAITDLKVYCFHRSETAVFFDCPRNGL